MNRTRLLILVFVLIGIGIATCGFIRYGSYFSDDAFISLRYCHNFLAGEGLVWNPGERVEGYSNFLFILLVSLLAKAGIDLTTAARLIGVVSYFVVLLVMVRFAFRKSSHGKTALPLEFLPAFLAATSFCLVAWSVGGLETTLFALLVTSGMLLLWPDGSLSLRKTVAGAVPLGLATLTRPDGALFFALALLCNTYNWVSHREPVITKLMALAAPYLLMVGGHELWRYSYYGDWLPNTWYVKGGVSAERFWLGLRYLGDYAFTPPYLPVWTAVALLYRAIARTWSPPLTYLVLSISAYLLYVASHGGDHMSAFRPVVAVIPLMSILLVEALRPLLERSARAVMPATLGAFAVFGALQLFFPGPGFRYASHMDNAAFSGMIVGQYINRVWPPGVLVALNSAGATPFYAPSDRFIDMLGLNDRTIARRTDVPRVSPYQLVPGHGKGDGRYVFDRRPDYIIAGPSNGSDLNHAWTLSEYEMARIVEFPETYRLTRVQIPVTEYPGYRDHGDTRTGTMTFAYYERVK